MLLSTYYKMAVSLIEMCHFNLEGKRVECGCKTETKHLFLEGEYGADPVWCAICEYNIELDELPIDSQLMDELLDWGNAYGQWIDLEHNEFVEDGEALETAHNNAGATLAKKLQMALQGVKVDFHPAAL